MNLTQTQIDALTALANENGMTFNRYVFQAQGSVAFQIPGNPSAEAIIYKTGKTDVRGKNRKALLVSMLAIVNQK